ncbi:protein of unknown function [Mucilaginibacter pineti]|uniref:DUF4133 domain-containing protein n=1 Tax=Mucilaginibacter pineti TaxID=1391627 RepID=A0A1G7IQ82_9SPHI|nr:DUF4133 domain-containing protein [Mucilaginibacter pineti]SDF14765.1 protein of unknown function [Mucilaginibacter pineti]
MGNSVYAINKGINKSIEFKGLKAQYIWYLAGGVMGLLLLFAGLAIIGVNQYICVVLILPLGGVMVLKVYQLSNKYGEHGLMKEMARRSVPKLLKSKSRSVFYTGNQDAE